MSSIFTELLPAGQSTTLLVAHDTPVEEQQQQPVAVAEQANDTPALPSPSALGLFDPIGTRFIESCVEDAKTEAIRSCKNFRNKSAYAACVAAQTTAAEQVKTLSTIDVYSVSAVPSPINENILTLQAAFIPDPVGSAAIEAGRDTCEISLRAAQKSEGWSESTLKDHITDCRKAVPRSISHVEKCLMKRWTGGRGRSFSGLRTVTGSPVQELDIPRLQRRRMLHRVRDDFPRR